MSQSRKLDEDTDMSLSYVSRAPAGHSQQLPSFRELLPPHLHDEIDSSTYQHSRQSQERPSSGHEMASDPRSIPGYPTNPPTQMPYGEYSRDYTTRAGDHPQRPMSDHMPMRGQSPMLPPIRDLGSMPERQGYPDSRMAPRSDPFASEYRGIPPMPALSDRRNPEPLGAPIMQGQAPHGHPAMAYQGDPEHISPQVMPHPQQANFGILGDPVDPRTRRRRGNLPKPVTDILRAWFHEHLDHPYPSEEDKQMFMTRTGLTISQISNWFINARRRQLPALRNQMRSGATDPDSSRQSPFSDIDDHMPSPHH